MKDAVNGDRRFELFDRIPLGMCVLQDDWRIIFWNRCLENWTKIPRSRILGCDIGDYFPHLKEPKYANRLQSIFAGGPPIVFSSQLHKHFIPAAFHEGKLRVQQTTVTATRNLDGTGFYAVLTIQDVTDLTHQSQAYRNLRDRALAEIEERKKVEDALRESEERFRKIFEEGPLGMAIFGFDNRLIKVNETLRNLLEYSDVEMMDVVWGDLTHPDDRTKEKESLERLFSGEHKFYKMEKRCLKKTGESIWVSLTASTIRDEFGTPIYYLVMIEDIHQRKQSERALQETHRELKGWVKELEMRNQEITLLSQMSEFLQACLTVEEAYKAIANLVQPLFPNISGVLFAVKTSPNQLEAVAIWGNTLASEKQFSSYDCWALRRGRSHWVADRKSGLLCNHLHQEPVEAESLCVPMTAQGETLGLLYLTTTQTGQLTEAKQQLARTVAEHISLAISNLKLRETLHDRSIRDPLTGLFNRRYLEEVLIREIHRAQRKQYPLSAIMIDIDRFKHFNDTFGHEAGDAVLQALARFLQQNIRKSDIACRYGGEELTLILPEASSEISWQRAEKLRQGVKQLNLQYRGRSLGAIALSCGIACFPEHGLTGEAVLRAADTALYRAKKEGRDRTIISAITHLS